MNLVGKILTGLIALFSIVFMTLVLAIYATHTNWRDAALNKEKERDQARKEKDETKAKLDELQKAHDLEKTAWAGAIGAEKQWKTSLEQASADQKKTFDQGNAERTAALTTLNTTQMNLTDLYAQVHGGKNKEQKGLLVDLAEERTRREAFFQKAVEGQQEVQQLQNRLATLRNQQQTLVADAQRYRDIIVWNNLSLNLDDKVAPDVKGRVVAVSLISGSNLVEIDIGRDAGLRQGHQLHVYRAAGVPYLGKVEVVETKPERAVCKVLPEFQKGPIQRDDHVAAQIRFQ